MQNNQGRIFNSIRNISTSLLVQVLNAIIVFISRTVFIKTLGIEYLGISGLFGSILTILSLGELGIGEAITFALYRPLMEKDNKKINILMGMFKRFYTRTSFIISTVGILLLPFLDNLIKTESEIQNLKLIYVLFIVNSSISYLFSYNKILLIADQKSYKTTTADFLSNFILNVLQIITLLAFNNYILYLVLQIIFTLIQNLTITYLAKKEYPFMSVSKNKKYTLDKDENDNLNKNMKSLMIQKLGSVTTQGIDNIIISNFIGISSTGLLSNYTLLVNYITKFINIFFNGISASVGNLVAEGNRNKMLELFYTIYFGTSWIYTIVSVILINLVPDFIFLWIGENYIMSTSTTYFVVLNFYFMGMRHSVNVFKNAMGLYWYDRYKPFISAIVNIIISVFLSQYLGVIGVLIGTSISLISVNLWIEPFVLFKYGFQKSPKIFFFKYIKDLLVMLVISASLNWVFIRIELEVSIFSLLLKGAVIFTIAVLIQLIRSINSTELQYYRRLLNRLFTRKKI